MSPNRFGAVAGAVASTGVVTGALWVAVLTGSGTASADALCDQLRAQYGPGWPCVSVPTPPPTPEAVNPAPTLPGQEEGPTGGPQAGANPGPGPGLGNGTPIVPVPQQPAGPPPSSVAPTAPSTDNTPSPRVELPDSTTESRQGIPTAPPNSAPSARPVEPNSSRRDASTPPAIIQQSGDAPNNDDDTLPVPALALASAALVGAVRPRSLRNTVNVNYSGDYSALPGTPIPKNPSQPGMSAAFGTARIVPGQGVKSGFYDPGMTSALAQKWGATIKIDPDTPGATGPYSGNLIQPDPLSGQTSVGLPGWNQGVENTRKPGSINIDAVKGAKLRIVEAQPISLSTVNYGGLPELVINYQFKYQVQYTYTFVGNAIVYSTEWTDISLDEVAALQGMGVTVPKID